MEKVITKDEMIRVLEELFRIEERDGNLALYDNCYGEGFAMLYFDENGIYIGYDM